MPKVTIKTDNKTIEVKDGYPLIDMCEDHDTSILFGCRDGACGACMIRVIDGDQFISLSHCKSGSWRSIGFIQCPVTCRNQLEYASHSSQVSGAKSQLRDES